MDRSQGRSVKNDQRRALVAFVLVTVLGAVLTVVTATGGFGLDLFGAGRPIAAPAVPDSHAAALQQPLVAPAPATVPDELRAQLPVAHAVGVTVLAPVPPARPTAAVAPAPVTGAVETVAVTQTAHDDRRDQREAEKAQRDAEREAEKAQRDAERAAAKTQRDAQREAENARRDAERAADKAEQAAGHPGNGHAPGHGKR